MGMRALVVSAPDTVNLREVPRPEPPAGWARIQVARAGICATDLAVMAGQAGVSFPVIPGHEWMGIVDAVGSEDDGEWIGRRVAGENEVSCLLCPACRSGRWRWCPHYQQIGFGRYGGSYAEYLIAPIYGLHPLSQAVSDLQGALLEPAAVALGVLERAALRIGETVTVIGDGPIGLNVLIVAKAMGARRIIVGGEQPVRLAMAERLGAYRVVRHPNEDLVAAVTAGHGQSDVVVEATGTESGLQTALNLVRPEGRLVVAGFAHGGQAVISPDRIHLPDVAVIGAGNNPGWMGRTVALVEDGMLRTDHLVTHRYALAEFADAFGTLSQRGDGLIKAVFEINPH